MNPDPIDRPAEVLGVHEVVFIDHEVGYECGCNEHGTGHPEGLRFQSDALRHQARALDSAGLLATPEHDAAVAAKALRDAQTDVRATLNVDQSRPLTIEQAMYAIDFWLGGRADRIESGGHDA